MNSFIKSAMLFCLSLITLSAEAEFSLDKYRIVLDEQQKRTDLRLYNTGQKFGNYRIQMVDLEMDAKGNLVKAENFKYSAKQLLRVGPRLAKNITPQGYQKVRVRARGSKESGEFRTHLYIEEILAPYEGDLQGMILRPKLKVVIPIFVTSGELNVAISAEQFTFNAESKELTFQLKRTGNASAYGNIIFTDAHGQEIHRQNGVGIYREINERTVTTQFPQEVQSIKGLTFIFEKPEGEAIVYQRSI